MLRLCSRVLVKVGKVKPSQRVKPVPVAPAAGRNLTTQQTELPRLPLPPLRQTLDRYLRILEPVVEEDELKRTKELVEEFQKAGGLGERLQRGLEWRERNTENWVTEHYVEQYLKAAIPLVIFSNPSIRYPPMDPQDSDTGQIRSAARTIAGHLDAKIMIDSGSAPVGFTDGKPLCMKQCEQIMSACQVPGVTSDSLVFHNYSSNPPKHITVVRNGQFFKLDVINGDGSRLSVDQLCGQLEKICNWSQQTDTDPVGILTTQRRDVWRRTYSKLIEDETNRESLSAIQSSIFTVCLDGPMAPVSHHKHLQMVHGGGSRWNSGNRWFDKMLQIIVGEDGTCGANVSHAAADGTAVLTVIDHSVEMMKKPEMMPWSSSEPLPAPQRLDFNVTPEIQRDIEEAKQHLDTLTQNLEASIGIFNHFGSEVLKAHKMSPNAFVQMAIQLAYYRTHRRCCPTSESISIRSFRLGRLAFINTNTSSSVAFVEPFDDPDKQNSEKLDVMRKAVEAHQRDMMMGRRGRCVETHLLMLRLQAEEEDISTPEIFTDSSYCKVFDYKIVTSQLRSRTGCLPHMAPEQPGAYSVNYSIFNNQIQIRVFYYCASGTCREDKAERLHRALEDAMLDMRTLLDQSPRTTLSPL